MFEFYVELHTTDTRQIEHFGQVWHCFTADIERLHVCHIDLAYITIVCLPAPGGIVVEDGQGAVAGGNHVELTHIGALIGGQCKGLERVFGGVC